MGIYITLRFDRGCDPLFLGMILPDRFLRLCVPARKHPPIKASVLQNWPARFHVAAQLCDRPCNPGTIPSFARSKPLPPTPLPGVLHLQFGSL